MESKVRFSYQVNAWWETHLSHINGVLVRLLRDYETCLVNEGSMWSLKRVYLAIGPDGEDKNHCFWKVFLNLSQFLSVY
ncbi:hypothetical protein NG54_03315 [Heyndrickxia ginsengihumi]|uniref:Uncharacterized protein n=1 Tax=Heyndrickxia ginsengihumi TaxID=363870 RepID=A0A0A6VIB0_9BACI|nr:hypothetical protein NG54_03315 [Heyndrickxia ginsengihumi]